jgi:hypothetical protein
VIEEHVEALVQRAAAAAAAAAGPGCDPDYAMMRSAGLGHHINKYMSLERHRQASGPAAPRRAPHARPADGRGGLAPQVALAAQRLSLGGGPTSGGSDQGAAVEPGDSQGGRPQLQPTCGHAAGARRAQLPPPSPPAPAVSDVTGAQDQLLGVNPRAIIDSQLPDWQKAEVGAPRQQPCSASSALAAHPPLQTRPLAAAPQPPPHLCQPAALPCGCRGSTGSWCRRSRACWPAR